MKTKWSRGQALQVALELKEKFAAVAKRIEIAGSIRRHKEQVGDIELLIVPMYNQMKKAQGSFFDEDQAWVQWSLVDKFADRMVAEGVLAKRLSKTGVEAWGEKNKLALHVASGIPVDLFTTTMENWWTSLVIRTGGKDSNLKLATSAQTMNRKLLAYGAGVEVDGSVVQCHSEEDVFRLCGVPYRLPEERE